jgi:hypothetical protein
MHLLSIVSIGCGLLLLPLLSSPRDAATVPAGGRYIGAAMCKNCHNGADKGNAYDHWAQTPHAKAWENLASDKAKEAGKKLGVDDPQKSDKCLKCHTTAFGVDKKDIKASFKVENGVQCETCHGPGEDHQKKRFAEAMKQGTPPSPITADEIHAGRTPELCKKCHNEESPTYKPFCLKERMEKIEHLDPRKKRSDEELKKLRDTCAPDCKICKAGGGDKKDEKKDEKKPEGGGK